MFIDEVKIVVKAGNGGNGCLAFQREARRPMGGPSGGNGGNGADIILVADPNIATLLDFRFHPEFKGQKGRNGEGDDRTGKSAEPEIIPVPVGTVVRDLETRELLCDLAVSGARFIAVRGGRGGRGNASFKSSIRQAPRLIEKGMPGETRNLFLELKLIADAGIVGLPNAGKSSLLTRISNAHPKIADYPFTTLEPMLGMVAAVPGESYVVADIPGLIEGAHAGLGLGHQFLRHVERTRLIVHLIDLGAAVLGESARDPLQDYQTINEELKLHSPVLARKPQLVVGNKIDLPGALEKLEALRKKLKRRKIECFGISAATGEGIEVMKKQLLRKLKSLPPADLTEASEKGTYREYQLTPRFVLRQENRMFIVEGKEPEKWTAITDFGNPEAVARFEKIMTRIGVMEALKQKGIRDGDTVVIGDEEILWSGQGVTPLSGKR